MFIKRKNHELDIEDLPIEDLDKSSAKKSKKPITRAAQVKKMLKKKILPNKKIVFDEQGEVFAIVIVLLSSFRWNITATWIVFFVQVVVKQGKEYVSELAREYEKANEAGIDISTAQRVLREEDKYDKELFREKVKEKHREMKRKLKEERLRDQHDGVQLGSGSEDENGGSEASDRLSYSDAGESDDDNSDESEYQSDSDVESEKLRTSG